MSDIVPIFDRQAPGSWLAKTDQFQLGRAFLDIGEIDSAQKNLETAFLGFEKLLGQQPSVYVATDAKSWGTGNNRAETLTTDPPSGDGSYWRANPHRL